MNDNTPRATSTIDSALDILTGCHGKLNVMGKRFGVEVLDTGDHGIRVSFPFSDWPAEGMSVELDLPSGQGFVRYQATVAFEPETAYIAGLVLRDPVKCEPEAAKRIHCRIPTDLTVQIRETPHPRRFDALVLNLSVGGALLSSELDVEPGHKLAIDLSLPCHCVESIPASVIYVAAEGETSGGQLLGVHFENPASETASAISDYIDHHLQAIC